MKSILLIDTPKECWGCPLHIEGWNDDFEEIMICNAEKLESHYGKIPNYCPLKPVLEKDAFAVIVNNEVIFLEPHEYSLDEITGESEDGNSL